METQKSSENKNKPGTEGRLRKEKVGELFKYSLQKAKKEREERGGGVEREIEGSFNTESR